LLFAAHASSRHKISVITVRFSPLVVSTASWNFGNVQIMVDPRLVSGVVV
jgi:hypothetical protein